MEKRSAEEQLLRHAKLHTVLLTLILIALLIALILFVTMYVSLRTSFDRIAAMLQQLDLRKIGTVIDEMSDSTALLSELDVDALNDLVSSFSSASSKLDGTVSAISGLFGH